MVKGKRIRDKGKIKLSRYFQKLEDGSSVAVIRELGVEGSFPKRLQGRTGKVLSSRGKYKIVEVVEGKKGKKFIINPVHLKKI